MSIVGLRRIESARVYAEFVAAELESPRYAENFDAILGLAGAQRLRGTAVDSWTPSDHKIAERALQMHRGGYVGPLFAMNPDWFEGELPISEVGSAMTIKLPAFTEAAPSRLLTELVTAMDSGRPPKNDTFEKGYPVLRRAFDSAKTKGRPVLVAKAESGPCMVIEGLTRLAVQQSMYVAGEPVSKHVRVILGITPRLSEWYFA